MNKRQFKKYCKKEVAKVEKAIELAKNIDWNGIEKSCEKVVEVMANAVRSAIKVINEHRESIALYNDEQKKLRFDIKEIKEE